MNKFKITITDVATGETAENIEETNDPETFQFLWEDGNYACDCNRALLFKRWRGEPEIDDVECGFDRFGVILQRV